MITVEIGPLRREFSIGDIDEGWIAQQVARQKKDGPVCVRVSINTGTDVDIALRTPYCPSLGSGSRPATPRESKILTLWDERGLNDGDFSGGNVISFFKHLGRVI